MFKQNRLRIITAPAKSYSEFIRGDYKSSEQKSALLQLSHLFERYTEKRMKDHRNSLENKSIVKSKDIAWRFEVYKMKRCILQNSFYQVNKKIKPVLTQHANQIFILAMIRGHQNIVNYFINSININSSIFGSELWPSYFLVACTCDETIFEIFKHRYINYKIAWNGLTPHLLCSFKGRDLKREADLDFLSYQEYSYLNLFRGIRLQKTETTYPVFILDFLCMTGNTLYIRELLDRVPEAGYLSRLNFIVQHEQHLILIMTRYGFRTDQEYNGNTPLHLCCLDGDMYSLTFLLYAGFPIVRNKAGQFPNEVGSSSVVEKANKLFGFCVGPAFFDHSVRGFRRTFFPDVFKADMLYWINVLKYTTSKYEKYASGLRYLDFNRDNRILRASRFTIISVFSLTKSPIQVEIDVQKVLKMRVNPIAIDSDEVHKIFIQKFWRC